MEAFQQAAAYVKQAVADGLTPSAALAIGVGDRVYVKEAWGVTSHTPEGTPVNEHTLYDMASVTKMLSTTMVTLRLIARGVLDLADMLPRYFGDLVPEDKKEITLFHLLTHTSGYPAHIRLDQAGVAPADALSFFLNAPLAYPTGTAVEYSCVGFIVLGKLLERVTGRRLDELAAEEVFRPLGMDHTGYHPLDRPIDPANTAFTERSIWDGTWLRGRVHDENAYLLGGVAGNAGVFSDLDDCIRFARMLAGRGALDGQVFLPRCIFAAAIQNYTPGMDENRGLGFHLANGYYSYSGRFFDQGGFGHNGFTGPHIFVSPATGLWVALLTNRVHPTRENATHLRLRRVLHTLMAVDYETLMREEGRG